MVNPYKARKRALRKLGFRSYDEYLASDLWASIRKRVLARDHGQCTSCGRDAKQVHHKRYTEKILRGAEKHLHYLTSLCAGCHRRAEFYAPKVHGVRLLDANALLAHKNRIRLRQRTALVAEFLGQPKPAADGFVLTAEHIEALKTDAGGYTKKTLKALGIAWPPQAGWKTRLLYAEITADQYQAATEFTRAVGQVAEGAQ